MELVAEKDILKCFGTFWDLFHRIKRGEVSGVVGVSCSESDFGIESYLGPRTPLATIQNPGSCCGGRWRASTQQLLRLAAGKAAITDVVLFTHHDCRFLEGKTHEEHCLSQFRSLASLEPLAGAVAARKVRFHAWMEGERKRFQVFHPQRGRFVSPLVLR